jgi:hypothetical protein
MLDNSESGIQRAVINTVMLGTSARERIRYCLGGAGSLVHVKVTMPCFDVVGEIEWLLSTQAISDIDRWNLEQRS